MADTVGEHTGSTIGQATPANVPMGEHTGAVINQHPDANPTISTALTGTNGTAEGAREALIAVGTMIAFVIVATILAGIDPGWGKGILILMFLLLLLQGIGHVNPVSQWIAGHPLIPATA